MNIIFYSAAVMGICGIVTGLLVGLAGKIFFVEEDNRVMLIRNELPGNNCGGCGYAGCDDFARAVVAGKAELSMCVVPADKEKAERISKITGINTVQKERRVMHIRCIGTCDKAPDKYIYSGVNDCVAASVVPGGGKKACEFGCLGYGSCAKVCGYNAISIQNGVAQIDVKRCTGCGKCKEICPRNLIESVPDNIKYKIDCNNRNRGKDVRIVCGTGCIGCGLCAKVCRVKAIRLVNNLPYIYYSKCTGCGKCKDSCVSGCIQNI